MKLFLIIVSIFIIGGLVLWLQKSGNRAEENQPVAIVNGSMITQADFDRQLAYTKHFYLHSKQDISKMPSLENDILERMMENELIAQYAEKHKIIVKEEEVVEQYKASIQASKLSEEDYLKKLYTMYGMDKSDRFVFIEQDLLRDKVQQYVKIPLVEWLEKEKNNAKIEKK